MQLVFVDTNILISLFRENKTALEQFSTFVSALKLGRFTLVTNELLEDEYARLRERAISDGLEAISYKKVNVLFPPFIRAETLASKAMSRVNEAKKDLTDLHKQLVDLSIHGRLMVDELVDEFFEHGQKMHHDEDQIRQRARRRLEDGHPPGKKSDRLGDRYHWEYLLSCAAPRQDLILVSEDADFESELQSGHPKKFLANEWNVASKGGRLFIKKNLKSFLDAFAADVGPASDQSIDFLLEDLRNSRSRTQATSIILLIRDCDSIGAHEISRLYQCINENTFVKSALTDVEVESFIFDIYEGFGSTEIGGIVNEMLDNDI